MSSSCQALLAALKDCVLHSECVTKHGNLPSECIRDHTDELPEACQSLRRATFECKRGMVCFLCLAFSCVQRALSSSICERDFVEILLDRSLYLNQRNQQVSCNNTWICEQTVQSASISPTRSTSVFVTRDFDYPPCSYLKPSKGLTGPSLPVPSLPCPNPFFSILPARPTATKSLSFLRSSRLSIPTSTTSRSPSP